MDYIKQIKDYRDHEGAVRKVILKFYDAYCSGDRLALYSCLTTSFQSEVPLNYFLIHSNYQIDLGRLIEINEIKVQKEDNIAFAKLVLVVKGKEKTVSIILKSDFGGWKIDGQRIYRGNYIS